MDVINQELDFLKDKPVIDLPLGIKLAGGNQALALDMLAMLSRDLPENLSNIKQLAKNTEYSALKDAVHKLHGAACYCGTPRLKSLLFRLESDLKNHIMESLPSLLNQLDIEVTLLLEQHSHLHI